jgi:hypothetical protein
MQPELKRVGQSGQISVGPSHSGAQGIDLPTMPEALGCTGYRLTRNARSRSYTRGIDLPAMPEDDRAYQVSTCPQRPKAIGHTRYRPTRNARSRSYTRGIDLPAMPASIGHIRYRLTAMPEVDRTYEVPTFLVLPTRSRQSGMAIGPIGYAVASSAWAPRASEGPPSLVAVVDYLNPSLTCTPTRTTVGTTRLPEGKDLVPRRRGRVSQSLRATGVTEPSGGLS